MINSSWVDTFNHGHMILLLDTYFEYIQYMIFCIGAGTEPSVNQCGGISKEFSAEAGERTCPPAHRTRAQRCEAFPEKFPRIFRRGKAAIFSGGPITEILNLGSKAGLGGASIARADGRTANVLELVLQRAALWSCLYC